MPPYSWSVPGRKPGTSTKVTSGTLNASQKRTKRAALIDAEMSSAPASTRGWLPTTPTGCPSSLREAADDVLRVVVHHLEELAVVDDARDDAAHVVGLIGVVGDDGLQLGILAMRIVERRPVRRLLRGCSRGRYESSSRICAKASSSVSAMKCATPLRWLCTSEPPSSSKVTSSPVVTLMTSGPVMNMYPTFRTMKMKSVIAGEYTAPPVHGPTISESCGMTPLASTLR